MGMRGGLGGAGEPQRHVVGPDLRCTPHVDWPISGNILMSLIQSGERPTCSVWVGGGVRLDEMRARPRVYVSAGWAMCVCACVRAYNCVQELAL